MPVVVIAVYAGIGKSTFSGHRVYTMVWYTAHSRGDNVPVRYTEQKASSFFKFLKFSRLHSPTTWKALIDKECYVP